MQPVCMSIGPRSVASTRQHRLSVPVVQKLVGRGLLKANELAIKVSKTLFSYQVFVVAETTPGVDFILAHTGGNRAPRPRRSGKKAA